MNFLYSLRGNDGCWGGNDEFFIWVPAFAGMTDWGAGKAI